MKKISRQSRGKKKTPRQAKSRKVKVTKAIAVVEHFFGKINVAAFRLKQHLKVGDRIHIKGATTDFVQIVTSMQIKYRAIEKAAKGKDIGIRVENKCRVGDKIFIAKEDAVATAKPGAPNFMFPMMTPTKRPEAPKPAKKPQPPKKPSGYKETKFLSF
ncbi:MAG: hypothetical protein HQ509_06260 [Candidatus Marinimicrobia bacterium]|nr:hypothetical protein [Candidatus Neomarinimicrobiota bacterium]